MADTVRSREEEMLRNVTNPKFFYLLSFEEDFPVAATKAWMVQWWLGSVVCSFLYVVAIHVGQHMMKSRRPYNLRTAMTIWSAGLAVFSICGTLRSLQTIIHIVNNYGIYCLICSNRYLYFKGAGLWTFAMAASKLLQLGDTVFIVLRKQPLSFLHWYHHHTPQNSA